MRQNSDGFSLTELVLVLLIVAFLSAIAFSRLYHTNSDVGGMDRFLSQAAERIEDRRDDAKRLKGELANRDLSIAQAPPLVLDFADLTTTGSLWVEGIDNNGDCLDDVSNKAITCLKVISSVPSWQYQYGDDSLKFPEKWTLVTSASQLSAKDVPLIGNGRNGQGVLITKVGFDAKGRAYGFESGTFTSKPGGQTASVDASPSVSNSVYWAIYFLDSSRSQTAMAIAIYPMGQVETFHYDNGWKGFQNRVVE